MTSTAVTTKTSSEFANKSHLLLLTCAFTVLSLTTSANWLLDSATLVPTRANCLLQADNVWAVPLAVWSNHSVNDCPFWAFATMTGLLIAVIARRSAVSDGILPTILLTAGMALSATPKDLLPLLLLILIPAVHDNDSKPDRTSAPSIIAIRIAMLGLAVASSLEFGFVAIFLIASASVQTNARRQFMVEFGVIALAVAAYASIDEGFARAAVRPLSWFAYRGAESVLPFLQAPWKQQVLTPGYGCLLAFLLYTTWKRFASSEPISHKLVCSLISIIGLSCAWYTPLSAAALASLPQSANLNSKRRHIQTIPIIIACVCFSRIAWVVYTLGTPSLLGGYSEGVVDVSAWKNSGTVLLTDLSQTDNWDQPELHNKFQLVLNDRWDGAAPEVFATYAGLCQQLAAGEDQLVQLSNGDFGGFAEAFRDLQVTWIAMSSRSLESIRHFAVSAHWRAVAIDGTRVIFGREAQQILRATSLWFQLEWPSNQFDGSMDGQLVMGTPQDQRRIAGVLNSMRLPYAALRVLPADEHPETRLARTRALLELSHRTMRQAGQVSLLEQPRVLNGLQNLSGSPLLTGHELAEIADGLNSIRKSRLQTAHQDWDEIDHRIRSLLTNGDLKEAIAATENLPENTPRRNMYKALLTQHETDHLISSLEATLPTLSRSFQAEALFYLSSLYMEIGNSPKGRELLLRVNENSQFSALRALYLHHLTK